MPASSTVVSSIQPPSGIASGKRSTGSSVYATASIIPNHPPQWEPPLLFFAGVFSIMVQSVSFILRYL